MTCRAKDAVNRTMTIGGLCMGQEIARAFQKFDVVYRGLTREIGKSDRVCNFDW